jgi:4-hydroxybenzoate polyprenyltransferase
MTNTPKPTPPLCVDLDGTLVATDTLWETFLLLLRTNPLWLVLVPLWLLKGKAHLKHQIAQRVTLNVAILPYRANVVEFLQQEQAKGHRLVLATAANEKIALAVAQHLRIFEEVIASDANTNMKGVTKRDRLQQRFGEYDYMGDSSADLPIFQAARHHFLVSPSRSLLRRIPCPPERLFPAPKVNWWLWLKALRPHQWVKNVLILVPLILSHQFLDMSKLTAATVAFLAFCLAASSGYILNDLLDLAADRIHPTKRNRPFAAGLLPIEYGLPLFATLVVLSVLLSWWLPFIFTVILGSYLLITISYSFYLKSKMVLDIVVLAGLYTIRIVAGSIAVDLKLSFWLLAFSMFIFSSLAFLKRYVELLQLTDRKTIKHRNYMVDDIEMIASVGPTSGYLAVLVFSLYINTPDVRKLYEAPFILWLISPFLLYWITRIWFLAHRRQMLDDPVQFALTDPASWLTVAGIIGIMVLAKLVS